MQEIGVQPLVREDSTYGGATKPQLLSLCSRAQKPQLPRPCTPTTEAHTPESPAPQQEKVLQWGARTSQN